MATRTGPEDAAWSDYAGQLAANLRRLRAEAGLSQEVVAFRSGLTRYTYQKYEKGESKPGDAGESHNSHAAGDVADARR